MGLLNSVRCLAILGAVLLAGPAFAHPNLDSADPAADVSVIVSPKDVKLHFSEGIIAKFSGVELKDDTGKPVATGEPVTDLRDKKRLVVPISASLAPGRYTVSWHAVSEDTHKVNGDYSFRVIAEAGPSQIKSEAPRDGSEGSGSKQVTKEDGSKECVCKDEGRGDRARERTRDGNRQLDQRGRYEDRSFGNRDDRSSGNRDGYRARNSSSRYESRSRPDCVVDDDGNRYCRVQ